MTDEEKFDYIILEIERGSSLRQAIKGLKLSTATFYQMLEAEEVKKKRYARACEERAEAMFDEIIEISDNSNADLTIGEKGNLIIDGEAVQRSRLKIDARKWALSKMFPKKYGDKLDVDHTGEVVQKIINLGNGSKPADEVIT